MAKRKAQSSLEYSFLIGITIATFLFMQAYLRRGIQGQQQTTGDSLATPYSFGLTNLHEHFHSSTSSTAWAFPGPINTTTTSGSYSSSSQRRLVPLSADEKRMQ